MVEADEGQKVIKEEVLDGNKLEQTIQIGTKLNA